MSGVAVIRSLLAGNSSVIAIIPATRIMAGDLPLNTVMPAIAVTQIDSIPHNHIRILESNKLHTDRVQVSVLFKGPQGSPAGTGYVGVKAMMKLVLAACPSQYGTVNGIAVQNITPADEGPDLYDDATALHNSSRDFFVRWTET